VIDGGLIVMLIGALALAIGPFERVLANRRWVRTEFIEPALRSAFPPPPPEQRLDRLAVSADAAVESAKLRRLRRPFRRGRP
jgi:hypothetical protein